MKKNFYKFIFIILGFLFYIPVVYVASMSFTKYYEAKTNEFLNFNLIPKMITFFGYKEILLKLQYLKFFWNSIIYAVSITTGTIVISLITSYGIYRLKNRFANIILFVYTIVMLMPFQATCVPNFIILNKLNILDSYWAIVLPAIFNPFGTFLLYQFLNTIPYEYIESAQTDGASEIYISIKIIMPLVKNGIAALLIITFIEYFNMIEQPIVFLKSYEKLPLSVVLATLSNDETGIMFPLATLYMIPPILMFLNSREGFIKGIQLSGLK